MLRLHTLRFGGVDAGVGVRECRQKMCLLYSYTVTNYFFQKWMTELLYNNESELLPKVGCSS